jgi:hypothetical protein
MFNSYCEPVRIMILLLENASTVFATDSTQSLASQQNSRIQEFEHTITKDYTK